MGIIQRLALNSCNEPSTPGMEFTRQDGKQCDAALRREEISLMYYTLCFFNADLGAYLITLRKFSPQVNFGNFAIQKNSRN